MDEPPRRRRRGKLAIAAVAVIAVLLVADTAAWWWVTARLEQGLADWKAQQAALGFTVQSGLARRGGWPFLAWVETPDVLIASGADPATALAWHADGVRLEYAPTRPRAVQVLLLGTQTLRAGTAPAVSLTATRLDVVVPLDTNGASGVRVEASGLALPLAPGPLAVGTLSAQLGPAAADIVATGLVLPGAALPFGGAVDRVELRLHSTVPLPSLEDPHAAAIAWRLAGGTLAVDAASLRWGKLDADATARLALDAGLQPAGTATAHLAGFAEALDALARAGTIGRNDARVASALLGLLSHPNQAGVAEATVPLTLTDGLLKMGAMPLARMPPVTWP